MTNTDTQYADLLADTFQLQYEIGIAQGKADALLRDITQTFDVCVITERDCHCAACDRVRHSRGAKR